MLPLHRLAPLLLAATVATLVPALTPAPAAAGPVRVQAGGTSPLGHDRIGVRRGNTWLLRDSLDGGAARSYPEEAAGWQPVAGDLDGDGNASVSLFRDGLWKLRDTEAGPARLVRFGLAGDVPVVGDWDGDGLDTLGVFRRGRWFLRATNADRSVSRTFGFGVAGDRPVVGDWDGDGATDIAVTRGSRWYQRDDATAGPSSRTFLFGRSGDLPVAGDWDHDGRDTPGLFRAGTWFFKLGNGFGGYQSTTFGRDGDRPVVRRMQGLAPGTTHRVLRSGASTVHLATVKLAASSSPDAVLSGGDLRSLETTSSMARRSSAAVAVNGDFYLSNGRPVHAMAADGRLLQTAQTSGRAFSLDAGGTRVQMGRPDTRVVLTPRTATGTATPTVVSRWNTGGTSGGSVVGYTAVGRGLDQPQADRCYLGGNQGRPGLRPDGGVETALTVTGTRCYGAPPFVAAGATVLATEPLTAGEAFFASLPVGSDVGMTSYLGFPGAVDVLGGNPLLLRAGVPQSQDHTGPGAFFARQPRTAVGVTGDGRLLLVVVDGRQGAYSAGMTLGELADLMSRLGALDAINLDGGGSSTMYLNGLIANRPSDVVERGVANALVVLPGSDPGEADLAPGAGTVRGGARLRGAPSPAAATGLVDPAAGWARAAQDPGSVGGLADALRTDGVRLPADLQRAAAEYRRSR